MIHILLLLLAVTSSTSPLLPSILNQVQMNTAALTDIPSVNPQLNDIKEMLNKETGTLRHPVINKVMTTLKCSLKYDINHNNILTIIDYSLPSNEKRLWVFDLNDKKLLFHTYVSHGIRSGTLLTNYFSNKYDSKASSIGVYKTEKAYYGREGLSLRLDGLDKNFNDNAANRSVVMHGGWYVEENFIKKYGRPGRSWGCPALPLNLYQPIINKIKDNTLMVIYYPNDKWFEKSKFLTCETPAEPSSATMSLATNELPPNDVDLRDPILFADINKDNQREEEEPVVVISADNYQSIFHAPAPLGRMLRRQIDSVEYIALSSKEFNQLTAQNDKTNLEVVHFVIPVIIMVRGYYETQMKFVNMGKINAVRQNSEPTADESMKNYTVNTANRPSLNLKATNRFIRWLGL